jgi:hypothetical protein
MGGPGLWSVLALAAVAGAQATAFAAAQGTADQLGGVALAGARATADQVGVALAGAADQVGEALQPTAD